MSPTLLPASLMLALCLGSVASLPSVAMCAEQIVAPNVVALEPTQPVSVELEEFLGAWIRIEVEADAKTRKDAIDRAADALPIYVRGIARAIMHRRIRPRERYAFSPGIDAETIRIATDDDAPLLIHLDGITHEGVGKDGVPYTRTGNRVRNAIEFEWNRNDSHGENVYRISEMGSVLTVSSTIHQENFQLPIVYHATYHRAPNTDS